MSFTFAFVMDPIARVNVETDTTFAFMMAAQARGHRILYVPPAGLNLNQAQLFLRGQQVELKAQQGEHVRFTQDVRVMAQDCSAIFIRQDPPFDVDYLTATWLLSFAEAQGTLVVNSPRGIRNANEKLYALEFPELCPPTLVSASRLEVRDFLQRVGEGIAKPVDGHGGFGVFRLRPGDSNINAIVDHLTHEGRRPIIVQGFVQTTPQSDKRLLLIDGELRGAVKRVPAQNEHRGNVHVGGHTEACEITEHDQNIAKRMGKRLCDDGLFFVGLDVIGDKLIEVNVTSPTLVQELRRLGGPDLALAVIEALEKRLS